MPNSYLLSSAKTLPPSNVILSSILASIISKLKMKRISLVFPTDPTCSQTPPFFGPHWEEGGGASSPPYQVFSHLVMSMEEGGEGEGKLDIKKKNYRPQSHQRAIILPGRNRRHGAPCNQPQKKKEGQLVMGR